MTEVNSSPPPPEIPLRTMLMTGEYEVVPFNNETGLQGPNIGKSNGVHIFCDRPRHLNTPSQSREKT